MYEEYEQDDVSAADAGATVGVHTFIPGSQMLPVHWM